MGRNRLDSNSSMESAVCCGCLRLLFAVVGVGLSVTKVVYGAEVANECPSMDILPVYIVISGCLPVLLASLKQECDYRATGENRLRVGTAVMAILANLGWLIAGSVWTFGLLHHAGYGQDLCPDSYNERQSQNIENNNVSATSNQIKTDIHNSFNFSTDARANFVNESLNQYDGVNKSVTLNCTDKAVTFTGIVRFLENDDQLMCVYCVKCNRHFMLFTLSSVIIDWMMFVLGGLYLCSFCCHRVVALKDQLLIINV